MSRERIRQHGLEQAQRMLEVVSSSHQPDSLLRVDPLRFLELVADIELTMSGTESSLATDCSIAGHYRPATSDGQSPRITIAPSASPRRRQFTALHEYGHHLQQYAELADALAEYPDDALVEEAACDAFAAAVLLPSALVERHVGQRGPTADAVKALYLDSTASRAVCAIAASQRLVLPGVVLIVDPEGTVTFAASRGEFIPPARQANVADSDMFRTASRHYPTGGGACGRGRFTYRTGSQSANLYYDTAWCDGYAVIVATEGSPAWSDFAIPADDRIVSTALFADCDICGASFRASFQCHKCREAKCPSGHCGCTRASERVCTSCFLSQHPSQFVAGSTECEECRG